MDAGHNCQPLPRGSIVAPFGGSYLESYKVTQTLNRGLRFRDLGPQGFGLRASGGERFRGLGSIMFGI